MVRIWYMFVAVLHGCMIVRVRMRLAYRIAGPMNVLMMFVVAVGVLVRQGRMEVAVLVLLGHVQPNADGHQASSGKQLECQRLTQRHHSHGGAEEGCSREIGAGSRRPQVA